eukprot:516426-Pyramimonas_sp.AAC.1
MTETCTCQVGSFSRSIRAESDLRIVAGRTNRPPERDLPRRAASSKAGRPPPASAASVSARL